MSDISEFEARITAALERIGRAVAVAEDRAEAGSGAEGAAGGIASEEMEAEMGRLHEALDAEKDRNAQLEARVRAIHDRQEHHVSALEEEVEALRRQLMDHDREMQKLRLVNDQLRENNAGLRAANAEGLGDASLIDAGVHTELEALKVARAADATELDAILTELRAVMARFGGETGIAPESTAMSGGMTGRMTPSDVSPSDNPTDLSSEEL